MFTFLLRTPETKHHRLLATGCHLDMRHCWNMHWCKQCTKFKQCFSILICWKNKATSLTNHWQKAGPIHSLAWTPQSIQTAFFWWRLLFPIWQETSTRVAQVCMCQHLCLFVCYLCLMLPLLPEAHKAVFPRTTSRWRTCQPSQNGFCSSQTSSFGS